MTDTRGLVVFVLGLAVMVGGFIGYVLAVTL